MKEQSQQLSFDELNHLFAQLNPLDVERFYTAYSLWSTQQRLQTLQTQIDDIHRDIAENTERLEQVHPSALALATLARLQSNGVSDIAILDRMLERGEEWLDRTMQLLEYCEKIGFISDGYTKWCEHALEGAYDWIDSMQEQEAADSADPAPIEPALSEVLVDSGSSGSNEQIETHENGEPANEQMEELFLQKLMSDESQDAEARVNGENAEDEASMLDTTLKIRAISQPAPSETLPVGDNDQPAQSEHFTLPTEQETRPEDVEATPVLTETHIWQQETNAESVEATPVLAETYSEQTEVTMMVVEEPQELQELQARPGLSENIIETLKPSQILEYTHETVYSDEFAYNAQGLMNKQEPGQSQDEILPTNGPNDQHSSDPIEPSRDETPLADHIDESLAAPSFGTIYSIDQVETPNWVAAVEPEQESNGQVAHKNVPVKRKKGFWRTLLAILFHV